MWRLGGGSDKHVSRYFIIKGTSWLVDLMGIDLDICSLKVPQSKYHPELSERYILFIRKHCGWAFFQLNSINIYDQFMKSKYLKNDLPNCIQELNIDLRCLATCVERKFKWNSREWIALLQNCLKTINLDIIITFEENYGILFAFSGKKTQERHYLQY